MADNATPTIIKGLEGVYFTETKICKVDGSKGRPWYRGYSIESLAKNSSFEEVSYLILYGSLPNAEALSVFTKKLVSYMRLDSGKEVEYYSLPALQKVVSEAYHACLFRLGLCWNRC